MRRRDRDERLSHDEVVTSVDGGDETEGSDEGGGSVAVGEREVQSQFLRV